MNSLFESIITTVLAISAEYAAYTIAYINTLQKPYLSCRRYAINLFSSLMLFGFSFGFASYNIVVAAFELNFAFIVALSVAMTFPTFALCKVIASASVEKAEALRRLNPRPVKHRRT